MIALHHGGPAGHSASVLIALAEKGLDFESRPVDLAGFGQHDEAFLGVNPAGQVPVLVEDGRSLTETFFILLYLDDRYPDPPLGGADAKARYAVQKWGKYVETHIAPNLAILAWSREGAAPEADKRAGFARLAPERRALWQKACDGFSDEEIESAQGALAKAVGRVAEDLANGPWLVGRDFSLADIAVFPHVARLRRSGLEMPAAVTLWLDRIAARPRVSEALGAAGLELPVATMGPERGRWG